MTQQQHPITPPPELVKQWMGEFTDPEHAHWEEYEVGIATRAAQWGADQELEACCEWLSQWAPRWPDGTRTEDELRSRRRPKPPSLKEQALEAMHRNWNPHNNDDFDTIRRALEQLDD
jgi:hypothetical protein